MSASFLAAAAARHAPPPPPPPPADRRAAKLRRAARARLASVACVIDAMADAGDRAAVHRTAEALGLLHVHEVSAAAHRAAHANAAEKWLLRHAHASPAACAARLRAEGYAVAAACLAGEAAAPPLAALRFDRPLALAFGGARGVSAEMLAAADATFALALPGVPAAAAAAAGGGGARVDLSAGVAIALHWAWRERTRVLRRTAGALNESGGDLSEAAVEALVATYEARGRGFKRAHRRAVARRAEAAAAARGGGGEGE
ncbi:hypothetical protein AB1Y20_008829 [Prymnesium parvum]|uniref:tRNA/rRNA methyltransferase SpoU type domain-containing protein n=1 Tax=Prymnesium parvum TaxID=97485 RepID=A0AB34ITG6_PRYPA